MTGWTGLYEWDSTVSATLPTIIKLDLSCRGYATLSLDIGLNAELEMKLLNSGFTAGPVIGGKISYSKMVTFGQAWSLY